jgi:SAM-dependent methyltransferase
MKPTYRGYVGPTYDIMAAIQFNLLTYVGLREQHTLLDIGCGSLRAGRLFIPYLFAGNYYGIEPNKWLIDAGLDNELGRDILKVKEPHFDYNSDFDLSVFNRKFDYILAQSIFSHASKRQIRKCLSEAKKVMKKKTSIFLATFHLGKKDYEGDSWQYPLGVEYTMETMMKMISDAGLKGAQVDWGHFDDQKWISILHPKYNGWCKMLDVISVKVDPITWGKIQKLQLGI